MSAQRRSREHSSRSDVISVFFAQGLIGFILMFWIVLVRRDETAEVLRVLGDSAVPLMVILFLYASGLALFRFALTKRIFVSLVITASISTFPLLGPVISAWLAVAAVVWTRVLGMFQIGPAKVSMEDPALQWVRTFGFFGTYGIPVTVAGTVYDAWGGQVPLLTISSGAALKMVVCGMLLIFTNNMIMFPVQRAYRYSVRKSLTLVAVDSSIYLLTVPFAVVLTFSYSAVGVWMVLFLAISGLLANGVGRNLAIARAATVKQLQRLASLTNIGKMLSLQLTTQELLMTLYGECKKIVDVSMFSIALLEESSNELRLELQIVDGNPRPKERIPGGDGLNHWVVKHHQPLLVRSIREERDLGIVSIEDGMPTESWLGVPMVAGDHFLGVLSVQSYRKSAFTQDDVVLLTTIANQAAAAIENANLYKDLEGLTFALEHRVQQRTLELREANLRLLAADRSKNQFLANMSHELRTPLNSIIGFSDVLLSSIRAELPPKLYGFLGNIRQAGDHLLELINDILDLSKIDAGKMQLRTEQFDLRQTMNAVEAAARPAAGDAGIMLSAVVDDAVPMVQLDEPRVRQILGNLVSNALRFSRQGSRIDLVATAVPRATSPLGCDSVRIEIHNTGLAIAPDELARIFDEFYETAEGRRLRRGGAGLGLALVRSFVELHHGSIDAVPTGENGSVFILHLPTDYHHAAALRQASHGTALPEAVQDS